MCNCSKDNCIIKMKKVNDNAKIPQKAHDKDAAYDLYSAVEVIIPPGETKIIDTGWQMETTEEWKLSIKSRSGLSTKGITVANSPGLIDSAIYRGNIGVILRNLTEGYFQVNIGDRIAQMEPERCWKAELIEVGELSSTDRGNGGFGSTGV